MYLKTLELQGFKSFPDKTVIEFDKGMTAIVGANGSGKSNISDAVRWVLGEMSAKSLRGNKMEDVIFNGSSRRKPAGFAEVVMTIDNSDYLMKIDYDEVSVGRRLYRSGESEYYLNKKQVRLKDVVDLFLNTGIGREGYSVISQGKIAEIISLKGNERRELFEEAAGISRFRYRKHEAGLKLQTVNDNALRINDVLSEVQSRLPRLEAQSAKAKTYLSLAEEKKTLELGIWSQRLVALEEWIQKGEAKYKEDDGALVALTDQIETQDRKIDALYVETQENNVKSEILRGEVSAHASRESDLSAELSVLENEIHHLEIRREEAVSEEEKSRDREDALLAEKNRIAGQMDVVRDEMDQIEKDLTQNRTLQDEWARCYTALVEQEESLLCEKDAVRARKEELSLRLKEDEGFSKAGVQQKLELEKRLSEESAQDENSLMKLDELRFRVEKIGLERKEKEVQNAKLQLDLYHLGEEAEEETQLLQARRLELLEDQQRRDTLLRMERLLEGFSDSVKEVMTASGQGKLQGVCGPVSKLISTEEETVLAIETALGGGVQHLVVEKEGHAKEAISFLKKNRLGRATFLPLDTLRASLYDTSRIHDEGFVDRADRLCRSEEKYRPAVEFLLGKTLICRDLESASRVAKGERFGVKIVTLDGQVIHAGGSFTGGQSQNKSGVLSRTGDLSRLKEKIEEGEKKIAQIRTRLEHLEERRTVLREQSKAQESALEEIRRTEGEAKNTLQLESERLTAAKIQSGRIAQEIGQLEERISTLEKRAKEMQEEGKALFQKEERLSQEMALLKEEKGKKEEERERLIVAQGEILALRGTAQLRLEQIAQRMTENEELFRRLEESGLQKDQLLRQLEEKKEEALSSIRSIQAEREEIRQRISQKKEEIRLLQERVGFAGEETARIRNLQKEKLAEKEKRMEEFSKLASRLSAANKEKEEICHALWEEYELNSDSEAFLEAKNIDTDALGGKPHLQEIRGKIRRIGPVNLESVQELEEAKERFSFLNGQYSDIVKSKEELEKLISDLESTMRDMFTETFEQIRYTFRQIFVELFGGGSADIELTNKEDLLNCGVEIRVQPPGKVIKNLSLLSGGEQAFVAIALYMALLRINPSPFCIFDEIESALDEANVRRFAQYIKKHNDKTQFIVITHRRGTMEEADTLYGITMQEKGVSDFIRLDAAESGKFASDGK